MSDERTTRRSGRRRRYNRRPGRRDPREAPTSAEQVPAEEADLEEWDERPSTERQGLPKVFIYTYTIYKGTDG